MPRAMTFVTTPLPVWIPFHRPGYRWTQLDRATGRAGPLWKARSLAKESTGVTPK